MAKPKIKVGILMGGPSSEHDVSLASGENIYKTLDKSKFLVSKVVLTKNWHLVSGSKQLDFPLGLKKFQVIFNALHGKFGEDGTIQNILDYIGVKYTGSGAAASYIGMDKLLSYQAFVKSGLLTPKTNLITDSLTRLTYPLFIKCRRGGSSIGVELVNSESELQPKLASVLKYDDQALAQSLINGREFTCAVLEIKGTPQALPIIEIRPRKEHSFFNYEAKYTESGADEIVPAPINKTLEKQIKNAALKTHKLIGCSGYSRSDFIVKNGKPYILEINTLPGLTKNSLLPKAANASGIMFDELLEIIISKAINK